MQKKIENAFWQYDLNYWYQKLNSSPNGLSNDFADRLLSETAYHPRAASALRKDLLLFLGQFKNPLMLLLIGAVMISAFLGDTSDVLIILFIVLSTGLLSFIQERNAGKIVEKLQSLISIKATVFREGKSFDIPSKQVVKGDIIILHAGDMIPADCLLVEVNELHVNESSLTGESYPIRKETGTLEESTPLSKRTNCLWEGTNVVSGNALALVIHTGEQTVFGGIALSVTHTVETTFEKGIKEFGFLLMKITLILSVFILVVNILSHKGIIDSALFALALAVGMAPELLPAVTTIAMSAGAKRLLAKKVIVKKLNSIQNLGEVNLLSTDKTGTLTEGAIKISALTDASGETSDLVKQLAFWNASFETGYSNPIDDALKQLYPTLEPTIEKIGEVPYDFLRKRLSIAINNEQENILISKGAYTQIISICTKIRWNNGRVEDIQPYLVDLENRYMEYGIKGLRAIAICYKNISTEVITKDLETEMVFAGFILLNDPVKSDIKEVINELNKQCVKLKIITGDNKNIARAIASEIGIQNPSILTGKELFNTSSEALIQLVKDVHIFAEIEPQQKERIILALKKSFTVAYMGDGINDVSAINAADVGISVENAVDVAREAADFVLMERSLMVLADGIKEGRKTFSNTLKYLYISTGSTFGNMCSVAAASLLLPFLPMLPMQILLTNFLTDFPFLTVTTDNVDEEQLEKPGRWNLKVIRNYMILFGIQSSIFDLSIFITFYYILKVQAEVLQTSWFVESVASGVLIIFIVRTHKKFFKSKPSKYLLSLGSIVLFLTVLLPYMPFSGDLGMVALPMLNMGIIAVIVLSYVITADMLKVWFFKKYQI